MLLPSPLVPGILLKRYKRFLADVRLEDGTAITAHCPNPGAMTGYADPGLRVLLSRSADPARKLAFTWELVHNGACWIGVHTGRANAVVEEALREGLIEPFAGLRSYRREAAFGEASRVDFLLQLDRGPCHLEVKSVTLLAADGCLAFPDAVTSRGLKHLEELSRVVREGGRAALLFLIQREDGRDLFRAAGEIDPAYARGLDAAVVCGVEVMAYRTVIDGVGIRLSRPVPRSL